MAVCEPTSGMLRKGLLEGVESAWLDAVPVEVAVDLVEVSSKAECYKSSFLILKLVALSNKDLRGSFNAGSA